jgi:hypothetical protein
MAKHTRIATPDLPAQALRFDEPQHRSTYYTTPKGDVLYLNTPIVLPADDDWMLVGGKLIGDVDPGMIVRFDSEMDIYLVQTPRGMWWAEDTCLDDGGVPILKYLHRAYVSNFGTPLA